MPDRATLAAIGRWLPALAWMGWIFWLSSKEALPPPPGVSYTIAAIAGHFILYAILTFLLLFALRTPRLPGSSRLWTAIVIALLYAVSDELHQSFVTGREASGFDLIIDGFGALAAAAIWVYGWRRIATY